MNNATKMTPDDGAIKINMTENPEFHDLNPVVDSKNLDDMGKISPLVELLCKVLGSQIDKPYFDWPVLRLDFLPNHDHFTLSPEAFVDGLILVASELKVNAKLPQPLPLNKAVTNFSFVPILRAISNYNTEARFEKGNSSRILPVLDVNDFNEPTKTDSNKKMRSHKIMGLYRSLDKNIGHGVYLSDENIFVRFPANDPQWTWDKIHDILNFDSWLEVGIERDKKGGVWHPVKNSTILRQHKLIF